MKPLTRNKREEIKYVVGTIVCTMVNPPAAVILAIMRGISQEAAGIFLLCYFAAGVGWITIELTKKAPKDKEKHTLHRQQIEPRPLCRLKQIEDNLKHTKPSKDE